MSRRPLTIEDWLGPIRKPRRAKPAKPRERYHVELPEGYQVRLIPFLATDRRGAIRYVRSILISDTERATLHCPDGRVLTVMLYALP